MPSQVAADWDMAVRSLLGLYSAVGKVATYKDKSLGIAFTTAVEEKSRLALRPPGDRLPAPMRTGHWKSQARSAVAWTNAAPSASPPATALSAYLSGVQAAYGAQNDTQVDCHGNPQLYRAEHGAYGADLGGSEY